jgi:prolipoprotein diacylglyceryl transferase
VNLAAIPSPGTAVWHLGPLPIRAYALCIVLGIVVASVVTEIRLRRRGAPPYAILDVAVWAVPFGIVGARIYHVITSWQPYFGKGGEPLRAFYIWEGGLGIWGAVAGGALGAWLACRQLRIPLTVVADALAPGLPLAQAVGRFGNWFNNELYGGPTSLPWGLRVHKMDPENPGHAQIGPDGKPELLPVLYHPTFLYEALWNVGVAALVVLVDRRFKLGRGRAFALYVMGYTAGRFWIELMRIDEANHILGLRLNVWTSILVFLGALIYFVRVRGPQEFLVPADAGFRAVTSEQYATYRETGAVPAAPEGDDDDADLAKDGVPLDDFADDGPVSDDDDDSLPPDVTTGAGDEDADGSDRAATDATSDSAPTGGGKLGGGRSNGAVPAVDEPEPTTTRSIEDR